MKINDTQQIKGIDRTFIVCSHVKILLHKHNTYLVANANCTCKRNDNN